MPPRTKRAPAWTNAELQHLISVWGEEAVQTQLRSRRRNYDTYGQISQSLMRRGHERDALQCRVKIKELRSAYCKAREGNHRSGAAPTTCRFYKELDAILGCDPTANPRSTMESSEQGAVGDVVEDGDSEATAVEGDTPESKDTCSQDLVSSPEEASQSQQLEADVEEEAEDRARGTLTTAAVTPASRRLQNLRRNPRKSKEELIKSVMSHYNREVGIQRNGERRRMNGEAVYRTGERLCMNGERVYMNGGKQKAGERNCLPKKTTKQMISLLSRQTESFESLVAMQTNMYRGNPQPSQRPLPCSPVFPQNSFLQQPVPYYPQLPPTPIRSPTSPDNYNSYPVHSTPTVLQHSNAEVQQTGNIEQNRTY
ncbi:zinc finger and SCAN domain-containing protein 29-like isoform X1 [Gopherus flavomarginatus]|uniref:zinc finger and SCAN domain-containing protein 29-like isoform X1 n=1 Tax=Gopherus flavomarginatus TaxID=286002 RepID=UPI0021CC2AC3|nr:zinc finger and SCAN domain-containing protein 29-like isoform X1 [Gopherus flavomarginatus]